MGDFDPAFVQALAVQSWSLYGIGMFLILLRVWARIHRLGLKGLQIDDYLMILAGGLYTALVVCLNVISSGGGSNLYPPEDYVTFTPLDIQERIKGSKIVIVSEQAMLNVIYVIKACMLIMYSRLTLGLQVQKMVFYLAIYVAVGWAATEIAFFTACTPFSGYYAMPPPNPQCTTLQHYAIVQACFNISSDTLMLFIPLPLITKLNMPIKQKAVLMLIFSMGVFVILAAILTKVFNLSNIWDPSYMLWYTREASVAVYVSNLPMIWPLLREWFPCLRSMTPGQKISSLTNRGYAKDSSRPRTTTIAGRHISNGFGGKRLSDNGIVTTIRGKGESTEELSSTDDTEMGVIERKESWEGGDAGFNGDVGLRSGGWDSHTGIGLKDGIQIHTTVQVVEDYIGEEFSSPGPNTTPHPGRDLEKRGENFQWNFQQGGERK
ncbi:uncharacterized protein PAC_07962 [Phialocephala subalpina]|uniref:Rhodopsin domain-containing protein n=1 Tax=Phialocephala subalpina TaxID=576137 RepID=A0A1L7WZ83_9HELO|nr:uncharacterized protein PAC_07962 [Phialocephala subalpina]